MRKRRRIESSLFGERENGMKGGLPLQKWLSRRISVGFRNVRKEAKLKMSKLCVDTPKTFQGSAS